MLKSYLFMLLTTVVCSAAVAQTCNPAIKLTAPQSRFVVNLDATVTDQRTGLTWQRCPVGFTLEDGETPEVFTDDRCIESAQTLFNWQGMLLYAQELNLGGGFAGQADWRVPNARELMSIVERQCTGPAINPSVFPDTPVGAFWSSSARASLDAFIVDFQDGNVNDFTADREDDVLLLRLVR